MPGYRVIPIPEPMVQEVRTRLVSPQYGHPAHVERAAGYGPCRSCLETFRTGDEDRILFTYNPFDGVDPYPQPGPVFVHREQCPSFAGSGFPEGLRTLPLTLEAFGRERWLIDQVHLGGSDPEEAIARLLGEPQVGYLHIRNTEAGCFIARVERTPPSESAAVRPGLG